jgi:microcystin degradation protein MlrC
VEAFDDALRLEGFQPYGLSQGGWARLRFGPIVATFHESPIGVTTPAHMRAMGVDPVSHKIYVVKLGYLHPQLEDIAKRHILLVSPGTTDLDIRKLSWSDLPRPFYPLDPGMGWSEQSAEHWISPHQ